MKMKWFTIVCLCSFVCAAASDDSKCVARHGKCQEDSLHCAGTYANNMCSGQPIRRCCLQRSMIDCPGGHRYSATGTGYYPGSSAIERRFVDMRDSSLKTLQDYLAGYAGLVTVAMDNRAGIAYDTPVCIPEMNHRYGQFIEFRVRDTGSAFYHKGHSRIDICVRTESDSFDNTINGPLTLVFY